MLESPERAVAIRPTLLVRDSSRATRLLRVAGGGTKVHDLADEGGSCAEATPAT